ncbi:MAG TPA: universal stress protein [Solirubrobacteraceae bacterium]|nr:universal stress protein [Solirubrobacteraceae bacterium]
MAILPRHRLAELGRPTLDRVLCAVDGSRASAEAIREALAVATCATRLSFIAITDEAEGDAHRVASLAAHRARQTLEEARSLAAARALPAETKLVRAASVVETLIDQAVATTLLVVGSHGGALSAEPPNGSVATALAGRAAGPLLIARAGAAARGAQPRILVAVDDSAAAVPLAALAGSIAAACHGHVHLVHVQGRGYGSHTRHRLAELSTALIEQTGSEPVVEVACSANVGAHICRVAQDSESSVVVVGRRQAAARRSVAAVDERVVQDAACSVLVVPTPAA